MSITGFPGQTSGRRTGQILTASVAAAVGVTITGLGAHYLVAQKRSVADATVVDFACDLGSHDNRCYVAVTFQPAGQSDTVKVSLPIVGPRKIGDKIKVWYDPKHPQRASVSAPNLALPIAGIASGVVLIVVAIVIAAMLAKRPRMYGFS
jgi:hypothetical protein